MPIRRGLEFEDQVNAEPAAVVTTQVQDRVAQALPEYLSDAAAYTIVQRRSQPTAEARRTHAIPMVLLNSLWEFDRFRAVCS